MPYHKFSNAIGLMGHRLLIKYETIDYEYVLFSDFVQTVQYNFVIGRMILEKKKTLKQKISVPFQMT